MGSDEEGAGGLLVETLGMLSDERDLLDLTCARLAPIVPSMVRRLRTLKVTPARVRDVALSELLLFATVNGLPIVPTCASSACLHRLASTRPDKLALCASCSMTYACGKPCQLYVSVCRAD